MAPPALAGESIFLAAIFKAVSGPTTGVSPSSFNLGVNEGTRLHNEITKDAATGPKQGADKQRICSPSQPAWKFIHASNSLAHHIHAQLMS